MVVICGAPRTGKSTVAAYLARELAPAAVSVVSAPALARPSPADEKTARAQLRADVDRALALGGLVVVDAPNDIKGFRYELYCAARARRLPTCVVYCAAADAAAERAAGFEPPSAANRWERPLFVLPGARIAAEEAVDGFSAAVDLDVAAVAAALGVVPRRPAVRGIDRAAAPADPAYLSRLDAATRAVAAAVVAALPRAAPGDAVAAGAPGLSVVVGRRVSPADVHAARKQFLKLAATSEAARVAPEDAAAAFAQYLASHLAAEAPS